MSPAMILCCKNICDSTPSSKSMTVARLFNVRPDMHASERTLLGEIAFCAALSEKRNNPTDFKPVTRYLSISHLYQLQCIL